MINSINVKINCQQIILNGQDQTGGYAGIDAGNPKDVVINYIPPAPFGCAEPVEVIVNASAMDGNPMPQEVYSFSITDNQPPSIDQNRLVPAAGATGVAVNSPITAYFTDVCPGVSLDTISMKVNDVDVTSFLQHSGTPAERKVSYNPVQPFGYGSTVNVALRAEDISGAVMVQEFTYSFTTTSDNLPPSVTGLSPAPGASGVRRDVAIVLHLTDSGAGVDAGTISMSVDGSQVTPSIAGAPANYTLTYTYTPPAPFAAGQEVTVSIFAQDLVSNSISPPFEYSFTIATGDEDTTAPDISDLSPADGATDVSASVTITLKISDSQAGIDRGTIVMTLNGNQVSPVISGNASSYTLSYKSPTPFTVGQVLNVTVSALDLAPVGNSLNTSYSFTVGKPPYLTGLSPAAGATQVSPTEPVRFNLLDDESGVNLASLSVTFNQAGRV